MVHKVDCGLSYERIGLCVVVKVKVTEKVQNSSECSSGWYLFSCWTFCNQTWCGDASSWPRVSCKLLYLLNCWSFCCQTWFDSTLSQARVLYLVTGLLCSRSRSQQNSKTSVNVQMVFSELRSLLLPNLVWWCIIMSQIVFQRDWFAVFKAKVTVKDNIIKIWL